MALNSTIRTVPLSANCDLSRYNQAIKDYNGFKRCNSMMMNNRLSHWYYKQNSSTDHKVDADGIVTWEIDSTDSTKFNLKTTSSTVAQISRKGFKFEETEVTSDFINSLSKKSNPVPNPVISILNEDFTTIDDISEYEAVNIQKISYSNIALGDSASDGTKYYYNVDFYHPIGESFVKVHIENITDSTKTYNDFKFNLNTTWVVEYGLIGMIFFPEGVENSRIPDYSFIITVYSGNKATINITNTVAKSYEAPSLNSKSDRVVVLDSRYLNNGEVESDGTTLSDAFDTLVFRLNSDKTNVNFYTPNDSGYTGFGPVSYDLDFYEWGTHGITAFSSANYNNSRWEQYKVSGTYSWVYTHDDGDGGTDYSREYDEFEGIYSIAVPPMYAGTFSANGVHLWSKLTVTSYKSSFDNDDDYYYDHTMRNLMYVEYMQNNRDRKEWYWIQEVDNYNYFKLSMAENSDYTSSTSAYGYTITSYLTADGGLGRTTYTYSNNQVWANTVIAQNYVCRASDAIDGFAVNYVGNVANALTYNNVKLVNLEDDNSVLGSDGTYIYLYLHQKYYRISLVTFDSPVWRVADNYYIFNSESGIGLKISNSTATKYYVCNSWNNCLSAMPLGHSDYWSCMATAYANSLDNLYKTNIMSALMPAITNVNFVKTEDGTAIDLINMKFGIINFGTSFTPLADTDLIVYLPDTISSSGAVSSLVQSGTYRNSEFTSGIQTLITYDPTIQYAPTTLLDVSYIKTTSNTYVVEGTSSYQLLLSTTLQELMLMHSSSTAEIPITKNSITFFINGSQYSFDTENKRIWFMSETVTKKSSDSDAIRTVCMVSVFEFIGYTTKYAYFYSIMDKGLYVFKGDNSLERIAYMEDETPVFTTVKDDDGTIMSTIDSKYIPNVDMLIINLGSKVGVLYDSQFCMIKSDEEIYNIETTDSGLITINDKSYTLKSDNSDYTPLPIEIETEFYGDTAGIKNTINDCVYLTVFNSLNASSGSVKVSSTSIQNNKLLYQKEKEIKLTSKDFNDNGVAVIKYQPQYMEAMGFKVKVSSDFEIADLKIGTQTTTAEQTKLRV